MYMNGNVKWFDGDKGYGFIIGEDGKEYFVFYAFVNDGGELAQNQRVSFTPVATKRGPQAQNVSLVDRKD
jgi:CspA family cold shock protein